MRPDQARFDQFSRHLSQLDTDIERFCNAHKLELVKNRNRFPSRILEKKDALHLMVMIYLDGSWQSIPWTDDLPHNVELQAIYQPKIGKRLQKRQMMAEHISFSSLRQNLDNLLSKSWSEISSWHSPSLVDEFPDALPDGWTRTIV